MSAEGQPPPLEIPHKIGYIDIAQWKGPGHRTCEAPRHAGSSYPSVAVLALAVLDEHGEPDHDQAAIWGACIECFGLIDREIEGDWRLPGEYLTEDAP